MSRKVIEISYIFIYIMSRFFLIQIYLQISIFFYSLDKYI